MKSQSIHLLLILILTINPSCHNNRLKTNEKKEVFTLNLPPDGIQLKEDRSVDPANPPFIIDLAGSMNKIKDYKLSDIASEIRYIRIESIPDSTFQRTMKFKYYLFSDYIVATNPCGILLYTKDGKYLNTIVRNITSGIIVDPDWLRIKGINTFIGGGTSVWANEGSLFYVYRNSITGQEFIMRYELSKTYTGISKKYDPEKPDQILGLGEIAIDLNPSGKRAAWKYNLPPEQVSWAIPADYLYQSIGTFVLAENIYAKELEGTNLISVFNSNGDTITKFTRFDEGNSMRFENEGKQLLWNGLSDTVFQIVALNRIKPVIVLDYGQYKLPASQTASDLTGKIIPRHLAENRNYIFLKFFKDAFDSPKDRKNKKVKMYHALYSKRNHKLFIIKGDPYNYSPDILGNNLDGGLPVWPLSHMIGNNGEILIPLKGKEIKDRVRSEQFKLSKAPEDKKNELKRLADLVSDTEDILMIVK